jgi:hypothetical protein
MTTQIKNEIQFEIYREVLMNLYAAFSHIGVYLNNIFFKRCWSCHLHYDQNDVTICVTPKELCAIERGRKALMLYREEL